MSSEVYESGGMHAIRVFTRRIRMKVKQNPRLLTLMLSVLLLISFTGCGTTRTGVHIDIGSKPEKSPPPREVEVRKGGPPPHAPAHGYRAKYTYRYYPDAYAYFDVERNAYFYLAGDRWRMSVALPVELRVRLGEYITVEVDSDKPYTQFAEHKRKYPPGQMKKKEKWAKKNKGKGER